MVIWSRITSVEDYICHSEGILNGAAVETHSIFHSGSHSAPFCITAGEAQKKESFAHLCAQNNYVEISLFKLKSAPVLLPTNWDLISKMLARLLYTKKPAGRGCSRWREVGWKANLGDAYVLRVPLGLPWVGRIWQKRSVQQKNPPLCLSMGY